MGIRVFIIVSLSMKIMPIIEETVCHVFPTADFLAMTDTRRAPIAGAASTTNARH